MIRLWSFNVCGLPSSLPPLKDRVPAVCSLIEQSDADIVLLQEVWWRSSFRLIRAHLSSYPFLAWHRGLGGRPAGGLVTFSRLPLEAASYTSFRGVRASTGGVAFRLSRAVNSALQGVLTVSVDGVTVANTHLSANHDGTWKTTNRYHEFQRRQLSRLHAVLGRSATAVTVVGGDFNIPSRAPLYPAIVDNGLWLDPFADTNPDTFHVEFLPPGAKSSRIDYILVRGASVLRADVALADPVTLADGRVVFPSDHVGLAAHISVPAEMNHSSDSR